MQVGYIELNLLQLITLKKQQYKADPVALI